MFWNMDVGEQEQDLMEISHFLYRYRYFLPAAALILFTVWKFLITRPVVRLLYDRMLCALAGLFTGERHLVLPVV